MYKDSRQFTNKKYMKQVYNLIVRVDRESIGNSSLKDLDIEENQEVILKGWLGYLSDNYKKEVKTALPDKFDSGSIVYICINKSQASEYIYSDIENKIEGICRSLKLDESINSVWLKCREVIPYKGDSTILLASDLRDIKISDSQWKRNYIANSDEDLVSNGEYIFSVFQKLGNTQPLQFFFSFPTLEEAQNCIDTLCDSRSKHYVVDTIKDNYCIIANKGMEYIKLINSQGRLIF